MNNRELPKYHCHKEVQAVKIAEIQPNTFGWSIVPEDRRFDPFFVADEYFHKHKPKPGGYYVVYQDGYESFSPAAAFESGYTEIKPAAMLGEEGTEQFHVVTRVDGEIVKQQPIHDPFVHDTVINVRSRWSSFLGIFLLRHRRVKVETSVRGTMAAQRRIMTMDPVEMAAEEASRTMQGPESNTVGMDRDAAYTTGYLNSDAAANLASYAGMLNRGV